MKRALFMVITDYPGGAERVTASLASNLSQDPEWSVEYFVVCRRQEQSFTAETLPSNVRVHYGRYESPAVSSLLMPFRLLGTKFDLIFTTQIYTNATISMMRRLRLLKTRRFVSRESMTLFDRVAGSKARLFKLLYRFYGAQDLALAQTHYMRDATAQWLPPITRGRLVALPNPVDLNAIKSKSAEPLDPETRERLQGRVNILFCGRFAQFKRPDRAVEVFAALPPETRERAQLVFLGRANRLEVDVRELAQQLGVADRVLFLGQRSNPFPVMRACAYGLVTSDNEGFPNVILEMMACGLLKIVSTPCAGDLQDLDGVSVTATHDVAALSGALQSAIASGEDRRIDYERIVSSRSAHGYLDYVLGKRPVSDLTDRPLRAR